MPEEIVTANAMMVPHREDNQVAPLTGYNLYTTDPVLRDAVQRAGAGWRDEELVRQGAEYGSEEIMQAGVDANRHLPELERLSTIGERVDRVHFHPAWHTMMELARKNGITNLPYVENRPGVWAAYAATLFMHSQVEGGSTCPSTMTKASIPLMQMNAPLWEMAGPRLKSHEYDARDIPLEQKPSMEIGMGMTEKQGGSDVRANTTRATPVGSGPWGEEFLINGHKWFFSAPMCDGHLVLARTEERGLSCFFVPRWRPDGSKNGIWIMRLKDKVGDRSNSSSEVEFHDAWGVLVGEEGRGIATIIQMASYTRLDCTIGSAAITRQALVQAVHYAHGRKAFGKLLIHQPLMAELLADMALESEAATRLAVDLAHRFDSDDEFDQAWRRVMTPAAKFWVCKRAVSLTGEAMEVFGGNGYIETGPMGRLYRQAPVNSIWEGSGNVMCLDVLRAVARHPDAVHGILDWMDSVAAEEPAIRADVKALRDMMQQDPAALEPQARRFTQKLVLAAQACLMLQQAAEPKAVAFVKSRFGEDWGLVHGVNAGAVNTQSLLESAWISMDAEQRVLR